MAANSFSHILLTLTPLILFLLSPLVSAQPTAPAPAPSGPVNLTGILDKNGQYTTFIKLLTTTQAASQIENQINTSTEGMTVLAPTDNAFNNLKSGLLNSLDNQQQVQLVLYHVTPKFYKFSDLPLVSNPVRTQATGQDGVWGLNFTGQNNQVNVSSGLVETPINNVLTQVFPLAVYQVDKVLLPTELFGAKSPSVSPAPTDKKPSVDSNTTLSSAKEPSPADNSGSSRKINAGLGLISGLALLCMGVLS